MSLQELGREGEALAVAAARAEGYEIIARNYRCSLGELDLVLQRGHTIVFAEVKTRRGDRYGEAWESVTLRKQKTIRKVAIWYVREQDLRDYSYRFDVFSIQYKNGRWQYRWFKDAF
jgi:putative endonuclease